MTELPQRRHIRTVDQPLPGGGGESNEPAGADVLGHGRPREHAQLDVAGNEIEHRLPAALISDVHELDLFLGREKFRDPIAHRAEAGRDVFDAARASRASARKSRYDATPSEGCATSTLGVPPK